MMKSGGGEEGVEVKKKKHREKRAGKKAVKKKSKIEHVQELTAKQRNPKAFVYSSVNKAQRQLRRTEDLKTKKQHIPLVDRTPLEPPPIIVAIVGPPKVGKSTLMHCLVKNFTRQKLAEIKGPVTVVSGKKRRITLIECNNDINCMIDIAKIADLVLLLIDASFGFEMEVFEFLHICQVHGFPKIMGVLTHLDLMKNNDQLKKKKKMLKHRFWTDVYPGAKLFYLSGILHGEYMRNEVKNLGRFISIMKFRPLLWKTSHPYVLVDRLEDITPPETIRQNQKSDRTICLYGYTRGAHFKSNMSVHVPGGGDYNIKDMTFLPDPCPLPEKLKRRSLNQKERLIYAPMSGVGGIVYDKDAVYIELGGSHSLKAKKQEEKTENKVDMVSSIIETQETVDRKIAHSQLQLFRGAQPIISGTVGSSTPDSVEDVNVEREANTSESDDSNNDSAGSDSDSGVVDDNEIEDYGSHHTYSDIEYSERPPPKRQRMTTVTTESESRETFDSERQATPQQFEQPGRKSMKQRLAEFLEEEESSDSEEEEVEEDGEGEGSNINISYSPSKVHQSLCTKDNEIYQKISQTLQHLEEKDEAPTADDSQPEDVLVTDNSDQSDGDDISDIDEAVESGIKWKENLSQKAAQAFYDRQSTTTNLRRLVYGNVKEDEDSDSDGGDGEKTLGGLFRLAEQQTAKHSSKKTMDQLDCSRFIVENMQNWESNQIQDQIVDCFVTGKWEEAEDAERLLELDDEDDDLFGDFEDLETGEALSVGQDTDTNNDERSDTLSSKEDKEARQKHIEKKLKLKEMFDKEYDEKGDEKTYYDDLKEELDEQAQRNRSEFEGMDDVQRVQYEGYRSGMYLRIELSKIPCEIATNFDPTYPVIVGGLLPGEENIGFVQVRIKKHRWYKKILKTRDSLIISLGWRRFQTLPLYSIQDHNMRNRLLKYTPEHLHCMASFWGPVTPQGAGMVAIQSLREQPDFRLAATGVVTDLDKSTRIVKKLKLTGTPLKIYNKTAFITGMFNTRLEVGKFEGAKLQTVSGIRGQLKKAVRAPEGAFRATFEDKIMLSDIVFCRTWFTVDVPKFYTIVSTLCLPLDEKSSWRGMKTVGQLRHEQGIRREVNEDNLYKPIEREPVVFKPLSIPRSLQKNLPYSIKPKLPTKNRINKLSNKRIAVVRQSHERKVSSMMTMLQEMYKEKQKKETEAAHQRIDKHREDVKMAEIRKTRSQKQLRKRIYQLAAGKTKTKK